jgi:hypothetical protein
MINIYTINIPQEKRHLRKVVIIIFLIDDSFKKIKNQYKRIQEKNKTNKTEHSPILFGDIHFLFISVANLNKLLKELINIIPEDKILNAIYNKYSSLLKLLTDLRNHLEHILDGRLDGKGPYRKTSLSEPGILGDLSNNEYNFGGDKINLIHATEELNKLSNELNDWNKEAGIVPFNI